MKAVILAVNMALSIGNHTMVLTDQPCKDQFILNIYKDTPSIDLKEGHVFSGKVETFSGCWYTADDKVFFIDSEGELLIPVMPKDAFKILDK